MQIRPSTGMISLTALLVSTVCTIGEPSSDAGKPVTAIAMRGVLAQLEAPIGHRQPTLEDLPPWLRQEEKPGTETNSPQTGGAEVEQNDQRHGQRRAPKPAPDDGVPRICDPC